VTAVHVDGGLRAVLSGAVLDGAATPVGKSAHAIYFAHPDTCPNSPPKNTIWISAAPDKWVSIRIKG